MFEGENFVAVENAFAIERHVVRPMRMRAGGDQCVVEIRFAHFARIGGELHAVRPQKFRGGKQAAHGVAHELVLQHLDFMIECLLQPFDQIAGGYGLLHAIAAAIESAFAPAAEVQHGFAQRLGWNGAGVNRHAAEPLAAVHHQNRLAKLGRLHSRAAPRRPTADHQHVDMIHTLALSQHPARCR